MLDTHGGLERSINSVIMHHLGWTNFRGQSEFLYRLSNLSAFTYVMPSASFHDDLRLDVHHLGEVANIIYGITSLSLNCPAITGSEDLLFFITQFNNLEEIRFDWVEVAPYGLAEETQAKTFIRPPRNLHRLRFNASDAFQVLAHWMSGRGHDRGFHSLQYHFRTKEDTRPFNVASSCWHDKAKVLELDFIPVGHMSAVMHDDDNDFSLTGFVNLETCSLRFAFGEMCVAANQSLSWITVIVDQLTSPLLRTITISLVVDNVEDLRSLNSECAVRELTTAYFDDMRVLDWGAIEKTVSKGSLGSLQKIVLEGQGSRELLTEHIRTTCPTVHSRSLISLVPVKRHPEWMNL
ncbi:hypothetical protein ONZ51_g11859 [Trametes cubensis]|uniref:Uncharacterized protein n=1 Tax=Trametes cubensis TaxID=1111947 RepID=A0AAD7TGS1_9APHY|nr:hypothetical protein ONZ51_g11859 [Trametes cubensis]